jgi:acid phosphatase type 7
MPRYRRVRRYGYHRYRLSVRGIFVLALVAVLWGRATTTVQSTGPEPYPATALPSDNVLGTTAAPTITAPAISPASSKTAAASPAAAGVVPIATAADPPAAPIAPSSTATPAPTRASTPPPTPGATLDPPRGPVVTIAAAGDIACDPSANVAAPIDCDQAATANLLGQLNPTAVLTLGDNQYESGTLAAFNSVFAPTWGKYRSIMYPAIGNHEYQTSGAAGYFAYFGVPAYYSFNLGSWHLISLDSECHEVGGCQAGSPQERWLLADLAAHPSRCTLVYWHEPSFSSGEHGDASQMATIWADIAANHVDVVLTGHNHDYERFTPLDGAGRPDPAGVTEFVVGTGGKNHYGFVTAPLTGELVRNDTSFGVISMTLAPTSYSWRFVPAPGYTFTDAGSANCV